MVDWVNLIVILVAGLLATYTDITQRKIRNAHLLFCFAMGIGTLFLQGTEALTLSRVGNILVAAVIALGCFRLGYWRSGDAKLFILFSFLMVFTPYDRLFLFPCVAIFVNTFLAGFLFIFPSICIDVIRNRGWRQKDFLRKYFHHLVLAFVAFSTFSWMVFPLFDLTGLIEYPLAACMVMCFGFSALRNGMKQYFSNVWTRMMILVLGGWLLRFWLAPSSLRPQALAETLNYLFVFSSVYFLINIAIQDARKVRDRIPFAPFLFIGCMLSYTDFLFGFMFLMRSFYR